MIKVGIIGFNEGNGHPFSFSAIINGYDPEAFKDAGWPVIDGYLRLQHPADFGFGDARVTHVWTQDADVTRRIQAACGVAEACASASDLIAAVDAVIIARDDWQTHRELALPALKRGIPVFVDKPLTLDEPELDEFRPYLESAQLMSTSAMRYAPELDQIKRARATTGLGDLRLVSATVLNDIAKYGIHMIEAAAGLGLFEGGPVTVHKLPGRYPAIAVETPQGIDFHLTCLGAVGRTFRMGFYGTTGHTHVDLHSNFASFRRCLFHFFRMIETRQAPIAAADTVKVLRIVAEAECTQPGEHRTIP